MPPDTFTPIFGIDCKVCESTPVVGVRDPDQPTQIRASGLCGVCHFGDRMMVDYELWNDQPESTD
jgi:hypothetical protein